MKNSLISIIIPIYNTSEFLANCLDSVINQTYVNLEIILINDGSTDNSLGICREYNKKDSRIIVINKKNEGVSSARNAGLDIFSGDYVTFIDSDDWVETDFIEILNQKIKDTDISTIGMKLINSSKETLLTYSIDKSIYLSSDKVMATFLSLNTISSIGRSSCNKLYSRKILNNVRFDENINIGEDFKFLFEVFLKKPNIFISNQVKYIINERAGSLSRSSMSIKNISDISSINMFILKKIEPKLYSSFALYICNLAIHHYNIYDKREVKKKVVDEYKFFFKKIHFQDLKFTYIVFLISPRISSFVYKTIKKLMK